MYKGINIWYHILMCDRYVKSILRIQPNMFLFSFIQSRSHLHQCRVNTALICANIRKDGCNMLSVSSYPFLSFSSLLFLNISKHYYFYMFLDQCPYKFIKRKIDYNQSQFSFLVLFCFQFIRCKHDLCFLRT